MGRQKKEAQERWRPRDWFERLRRVIEAINRSKLGRIPEELSYEDIGLAIVVAQEDNNRGFTEADARANRTLSGAEASAALDVLERLLWKKRGVKNWSSHADRARREHKLALLAARVRHDSLCMRAAILDRRALRWEIKRLADDADASGSMKKSVEGEGDVKTRRARRLERARRNIAIAALPGRKDAAARIYKRVVEVGGMDLTKAITNRAVDKAAARILDHGVIEGTASKPMTAKP